MESKSVKLYKTEGSSDKVYNVDLFEKDGAWAVHAHNGRRGKPLKLQNKGEGLPYEAALPIYEKLVKSKIKGGYTEHEDGVSFSSSEFAGEKTDFQAQLSNEISLEDALELGDEWLVQEKHDGERRGASCDAGSAVYSNRSGIAVGVQSPIDDAFKALHEALGFPIAVDAEDLGSKLVIFDIKRHPDLPPQATFSQRAALLESLKEQIAAAGLDEMLQVEIPVPAREFFAMHLPELQERKAEGFILRHRDSLDTPGKPSSGGQVLKVKFWKDVTCRVGDSRPGKRSVGLELLDDDSNWTAVGNVTIPANAGIPPKGSLIDVKYLYAFKGGAIYQPTYKGLRTDIPESDCRMDRLSYKPEPEEPGYASAGLSM
ncbi:hypothetical protein [Leisingera caerulea]|uniref:hypothetical protein n=1 Tax=Leisingera caerulea TaxID=506591 RepID=UPI00041AF97C|nr:hypothetical protein [Leisingera caerulea]